MTSSGETVETVLSRVGVTIVCGFDWVIGLRPYTLHSELQTIAELTLIYTLFTVHCYMKISVFSLH
jgi:hypothetical protein